ncbi:5'/3'-nucleotidase SurE [Rhodopirellula sp. JC740]|uniref:5'-nucleotidase n=1 Tax=Rhodopirellula halodulae TaxID=2894198 RepID=A0ABS8NEE0_9BACT|nr:5'/3'-nucleotidase SurE [Rhodopirellula sp. JC740]
MTVTRHSILLTNDDGIDAPGLRAMHASLLHWIQSLGREQHFRLVVVAPDRGRSECGHSVTTGRDLRVTQREPDWYAVDGTPVDCVRSAMTVLCPDAKLVFSGINAGANVGVDLLVSGTFAAAREASLHGLPSMAVSHYRRPEVPKTWDHTARWLAPVLDLFADEVIEGGKRQLTNDAWNATGVDANGPGPLWNVNLPAVDPATEMPTVAQCEVERLPMLRAGVFRDREGGDSESQSATEDSEGNSRIENVPLQIQSDFHGRPRNQGTDVERCFSGHLTISRLNPYPT